MNFSEYLSVLRKRWKLVFAIWVVCVCASVGITATQQRLFEASAQIFVSTATVDSTAQLAQGNSFAQARVQSYVDAATSPSVTTAVVRNLGLSMSPGQLAARISADAPSGKVLINLHVQDPSAVQAARLANAVATQFSVVVEQLELTPGSAVSPVKLTVLQPAVVPTAVVSPNTRLNIGIGVLLGLILGIGTALLREILDNTLKSAEQLAAISELPVLGTIPYDRGIEGNVVAFRNHGYGRRAEAFRHLRTNLEFIDAGGHSRVIVVTSAMPGEGKTHVAINIAAALAEGGQRVCLIEADLRRPTIAGALGLVSAVGLTSVLIGRASAEEVLQNAGRNLAVMTAGEMPPNPSELLSSDAFRALLEQISKQVDRIVVDTAPLLPVADGAEVAASGDVTVLAVRFGRTTRDQVRRAQLALKNVGITPAGAVLSMATNTSTENYDYSYSGYRPTAARLEESADPELPADQPRQRRTDISKTGRHDVNVEA